MCGGKIKWKKEKYRDKSASSMTRKVMFLMDVKSDKFAENGVRCPRYIKKCYFKQTRCLYVGTYKHFNRGTLLILSIRGRI